MLDIPNTHIIKVRQQEKENREVTNNTLGALLKSQDIYICIP